MEIIPKITEERPIIEAIEIMKKEKREFLPVVDENNILKGSITELDLIKLVKYEPNTPMGGSVWSDVIEKKDAEKSVKEMMNTKAVSVFPTDNLDAVLKVMNSNNVYTLPVTEKNGNFLGIVRMSVIFSKLLKEGE